jgi:mRNA-degrading endonuclease RelE of RelBE toxin-antitoxin system
MVRVFFVSERVAQSNPLGYARPVQSVAETPTFTRQAEKLFDETEKMELISFLSTHPLAGDIIPETGGVRKLRFAASGRGKRGGARIIYYYLDEDIPLFALLAYPKNAKVDLTPDEKRRVTAFVEAIKVERRKK